MSSAGNAAPCSSARPFWQGASAGWMCAEVSSVDVDRDVSDDRESPGSHAAMAATNTATNKPLVPVRRTTSTHDTATTVLAIAGTSAHHHQRVTSGGTTRMHLAHAPVQRCVRHDVRLLRA